MKSFFKKLLPLVLLTGILIYPIFAVSESIPGIKLDSESFSATTAVASNTSSVGFSLNRLTFIGSGEFFKLDPLTDSLISGTGLAFLGTEIAINKFANVKNSVWNGYSFDINEVPAFDRALMQPFSSGLNTAGDILQFAALLSPAVLMTAPMEEWLTIGVMYAETVLATYGVKEFAKSLVTRPRPYMYYDDKPMELVEEGDWNESFPSGHSALAFSGATFLSYVFGKYFGDSPWKYAVTAASYSVAAATAFFRVASGKHFLTDVLTGAAIGTAVGFVVPWLHSLNAGNSSGSDVAALGNDRSVEPLVYLGGIGLKISL